MHWKVIVDLGYTDVALVAHVLLKLFGDGKETFESIWK